MKICLIGDFSPNLDEGYKNISHFLANELEHLVQLTKLDVKHPINENSRKALFNNPEIIHAITQPTLTSLLFLIFLRVRWPSARLVISALRPEIFQHYHPLVRNSLLWLAHPALLLVQSQEAYQSFKKIGWQVENLPNGVDIHRFCPVDQKKKQQLREKYNLSSQLPVVLHVGHLIETRNLETLIPLVEKHVQVLVAGSLYMGIHQTLIERLERSGLLIFKGYQPNVEELYQLSDCYVFPLDPGNSLSMPLSVLEAMACNLPVVSTRFHGLETAFCEVNGLKFINSPDEVVPAIEEMLNLSKRIQTRDQVQSLSWNKIASHLCGLYSDLCNYRGE